MAVSRVALLSIHSSPLARVGSGTAGGMNVYVQQLADGLARCGIGVDMFTRRVDPRAPEVITTKSGARLIHLNMGPARPLARSVLPLHVPSAVESMRAFMQREDIAYDVLHSHYWLSGLVATRVRDRPRSSSQSSSTSPIIRRSPATVSSGKRPIPGRSTPLRSRYERPSSW